MKNWEFIGEKYSGEVELWKDLNTGIVYEVPIEIVRDFDNATEA